MDKSPAFANIYEGPLDTKAQYRAITHYGSNFFGFGNAFKESSNNCDESLPATSSASRSAPKDKLKNHPCKYHLIKFPFLIFNLFR